MRKIFRMKYEPCTGQCYAYSDVMRIHTLGLDLEGTVAFLKRLCAMHAPSCGNPNIEFRLDQDEFIRAVYTGGGEEGMPDSRFVASFYHYGTLDLFGGDTPLEAMNKMIDAALAWYATPEGRSWIEIASPADRSTVCEHGSDDKLVEFAIEFSGLNEQGRQMLRERAAKECWA